MAKTSGGVRNSKWKGDIYTVNGVRKEYHELNEERKVVYRSFPTSNHNFKLLWDKWEQVVYRSFPTSNHN